MTAKVSIEELRAKILAMSRRVGSDQWLIFRNAAGHGSNNFIVDPRRTASSGDWTGKANGPFNMFAHFVTDSSTLYVGRPRPQRAVEVVGHTEKGVPRHRYHMVDVQKFVLKTEAKASTVFALLFGSEVSPNNVTYTYWPKAYGGRTRVKSKGKQPRGAASSGQHSPVLEAALREGLSQADALDIEHKSYRRSPVHQRLKRGLLKARGATCAVTGAQPADMLIASHIKPWADCTQTERKDPNNVLLLLPPIDFLFDRGFITFKANGSMDVSRLSQAQLRHFGLSRAFRSLRSKVTGGMRGYLKAHREAWGYE